MKNYLKEFGFLSEAEIDEIILAAKHKTMKKDEYLIKEGSVCKEVVFVISGIFRSFYYSSLGEEITYCFTCTSNFITAYSSFITGEKTAENIQALTPMELFVIPKREIERLEQSSSNWLRFSKLMAEQEYLRLEKRIFMLQKEKAEVRYQDLIKNKPEYLQDIPLNYLASYLGISQRHLSRIRKEISI